MPSVAQLSPRLLSLLSVVALAPAIQAQNRVTLAPRAATGTYSYSSSDDGDRALIGVVTGSSGKRDTLGLLVESVTSGSPAEKAGIEEGNRIASINGVSLKLAREDAGESDMGSVMTNRLTREMRKVKAGDEVTLQLWSSGSYKTVKIKTVAADDVRPERRTMSDYEDRAMIGVSLGGNGSKRDTAGVFVSSVTDDGPADKAGIGEGDRIASINGVDLRVPREDAGDGSVAGARIQRLEREIGKLKAGATIDLVVVSGGRSHTVKVTTVRQKDMPHNDDGFMYRSGNGGAVVIGRPAMAGSVMMSPQLRMDIEQQATAATAQARAATVRLRTDVQGAMEKMRTQLQQMKVTMPSVMRRVII